MTGGLSNSFDISDLTNLAVAGSIANVGSVDIIHAEVNGDSYNSSSIFNSSNSATNDSVSNTGSIVVGR